LKQNAPPVSVRDSAEQTFIRTFQEDAMPFRLRAGARLLIFLIVFAAVSLSDDASSLNPNQQAWRVLNVGLTSQKASPRVEAVKALSLVSHNRMAERLAMKALGDDDAKVRTAAAATLGQLHATAAIPSLKEALEDKDPAVMVAAAYSLFVLGDKSAYGIYYAILMGEKKASEGMIQSQLDRLKDPKHVAQLGLSEGLGFVPYGGMGMEAYKQIMKRNAAPVRASAARFLAHDPDPIVEDALVQSALADSSDNVRQAALDALAERGDPHCIKLLKQNLQEKKFAIRYRTAAVIIHLSGTGKVPGRGLPARP
jgi:HEAT repeat protein